MINHYQNIHPPLRSYVYGITYPSFFQGNTYSQDVMDVVVCYNDTVQKIYTHIEEL